MVVFFVIFSVYKWIDVDNKYWDMKFWRKIKFNGENYEF